jgi:hypothetical protein
MTKSITDIRKKRGRPVTTGEGLLIAVRILPEPLAAIDRWIADQPAPKPTRPEAIRRLVTDALKAKSSISGVARLRPK